MRTLYSEEAQAYLVEYLKSREYERGGVEFRFYVGTTDYSDIMDSGDYGVDGGSPAWSLATSIPARLPTRLRGAPLTLIADFPEVSVIAFRGNISMPIPNSDRSNATDLLAATPGAMLDKVSLEDTTEYPGRSPENVLRDALIRVGYYDRSRLYIPNFDRPTLDFAGENAFADEDTPQAVIDAVSQAVDIIQYDTPDDLGTIVSMAPGTGEGLALDWQYVVDSHEVFDFPDPQFASPDEMFKKVVVRDRNEDGTLRIYTEALVDYSAFLYQPLANQVMWIGWDGVEQDDALARQMCVETARSLRLGLYDFQATVAYNLLLQPGRPVTFAGEYEDQTGTYWRVFRCVIDSISHPYGEGVATQISGQAVLFLEERLPDPPIILEGVTPGNFGLGAYSMGVDGTGLWVQGAGAGVDGTGLWVESAGFAGVDGTGLWYDDGS